MSATCAVCGGDEFNEDDGEYFCTVCQTQNYELRVVEAEEVFGSTYTFTALVPGGPKLKRAKKRTVESQPWTCDEAFLVILAQQAEALMASGASPRIKDVIFKLLTSFLARTGGAFTDCEGYVPFRERDKLVGNKAIPRIRNIGRRKAFMKEEVELPEGNEVGELELDPEQDDEMDEMIAGSSELSLQTLRKRPLYMKLATTLSICQMALLYTTDLVTSADVIKWINQDSLPYHNVIDLLPEFMELTAKDLCTFVPLKMVTSRDVRYLTGRLMYQIGLTTLPTVDIEKLISRHVAELELPVALNGIACRLYRYANVKILSQLQDRGRALPCHSAIAMGYIVVVLCLVFGCDDVTEKRLDRTAKENERSQPFFIFSEWMAHMDKKLAKKYDNHRLPTSYEKIKTCDLNFSDELTSTRVAHQIRNPRKIDRIDNRIALQNPLRTLLIRSESRLQSRQGAMLQPLYYDTPAKNRISESQSENKIKRKYFRHCKIYHLQNLSEGTEDEIADVKPWEQYVLHWNESRDSNKSETYNRLLKICSELAHCDVRDIELLKERLELVFVLGYSTSMLSRMSTTMRKRIVRSRFFN